MINLLCGVIVFDQTDQEPVKQSEETRRNQKKKKKYG